MIRFDHYVEESLVALREFDLLDKLIEEHINELREICESESEMDSTNGSMASSRISRMDGI
jgi:hypothetical protein